MTRSTIPSLTSNSNPVVAPVDAAFTPRSLLDLMYDGFYALFLLKNGSAPKDLITFSGNMTRFLDNFDRNAKKLALPADDIDSAKYAYCAALDETILRSDFSIRADWERKPLQLTLFGDQLAGEHFFSRLEALRNRGAAHIQALEVYHLCLLLGFEGKYILEGSEKLTYLTARLGDEISLLKGKSPGFAPHWARPDQIINKLRHEVPLWVISTVFALIGLAGYWGMNKTLSSATAAQIGSYGNMIQMPAASANITITLP